MAKILYVEDDAELRYSVAKLLTAEWHTVETVDSGEEALLRLKSAQFDLVILDLNLPDLDGQSVCSEFRRIGGKTPVLMLTGRQEIVDKTAGLDAGADDYLTKPFDGRELLARVRALMRRSVDATPSNILSIGRIQLDTASRKVHRDGIEVYMQPRDFELLEFLMRHPAQTFSNDALLDRVWHADSEVSLDALRSSVKRIRQKIGDTNGDIIENIPKVGYRMRRLD